MNPEMKNPAKRDHADGANTGSKENRSNYSTVLAAAYKEGRKRGAKWFEQNGHSLCVYRDQQRQAFLFYNAGPPEIRKQFDKGFAVAIADFIRGVSHD